MASLKHIPITLPANKIPTKRMLRDIISTFLTLEWPSVDPETLQRTYRTDFTNRQCTVERPTQTSSTNTEPVKLFIKFLYTSGSTIEALKHLVPSKEEETLLCQDFSRTGLGANVYGFFQTADRTLGRIDEFLDARNLEPEDVEDAAVRADVARAMARFHALETSLPMRGVGEYYDAVVPGLRKYHRSEKLKAPGREAGVAIDDLVDYDFASRVKVVTDAMEAIGAKAGWCIHDVQFMNTMVKHHPQPGESKVALIDFEMVMRNYRGFDIGGHFMQKLFRWFDTDSKIASCRPYNENEKGDFCQRYAEEWSRVMGEQETAEQVLAEAEHGYLLAVTFDVHNMLWFMDETDSHDPLDLAGLNKLFEEFVAQYRKLGLREPDDIRHRSSKSSRKIQ